MPADDLIDHAKTAADLYALLGEGIHAGSTDKDISRAYRRTALRHHPDKNKDDPDAVAKFHELQLAYDVLSDAAARAAHDGARAAREARKTRDDAFEGRRRAMKEDLERRESGAAFGKGMGKRKRGGEDEEGEVKEMELRRLAEEGRRRRLEMEEKRRKQAEAEAEESRKSSEDQNGKNGRHGDDDEESIPTPKVGGTNVPEISRTIKVRWAREGPGLEMDKNHLTKLFSPFGNVEGAVVFKDRKVRVGDERRKRTVATGFVVFSSIVFAHRAVEDAKKKAGPEWDVVESVEWAEGKAPDFASKSTNSSTSPVTPSASTTIKDSPSTPLPNSSKSRPSFPGLGSAASTPASSNFKASINGEAGGLRKVPSFASFASANLNSPFSSPMGKTPNSPSLEEITLIRLKNAEKKRLEDQIRKEEAEADKLANGSVGEPT